MENQIATTNDAPVFENFTVSREFSRKTKIGVVHGTKVRTILGVLSSGNKAERESAAIAQAMEYWNNKNYAPIIGEFMRVFGVTETAIAAVNKSVAAKLAAKPDYPGFALDASKPSKKMAKAFIAMSMRRVDPDFVVGEKLLYCAIADRINLAEAELQAMLAAPAPATTA